MLKYTGKRYVPKMCGEWTGTTEYEPLSIVTYQGASYTSKKDVPKSVELNNGEYWALTGDYNAQVLNYKTELTNKMSALLQKVNDDVATQDIEITSKVENAVRDVKTDVKNQFDAFTENINGTVQSLQTNVIEEVEEFKTTVSDEVTGVKKDLEFKTQLCKNLQYKHKCFIDFKKNDTNLHLQGMCKITNNIIAIGYGSSDTSIEKGIIITYDIETNTIVNTYRDVSIWHCNDMSYRASTNELYIASMYNGSEKNTFTILDYSTMTKKENVTVPFTKEYIVAIDCHEDYYLVATYNKIYKVGYDNKEISSFYYESPNVITQGIIEVDGLIFIPELYNIMIYDSEGNLFRNYRLPRSGEIEGIIHLKDMKYLISHSNNGLKENNETLKEIDLSLEQDGYNWTIHNDLTEIGIQTNTPDETIENICESLGNRTKLYWQKTLANESTCYPNPSGLLEITKYDTSKVTLKFTRASATTGETWIGNYNANLTNKFSGWKKLSTSDSIYSLKSLVDIGLTIEDFTTSFANNVEKLVTKMGPNKRILLYPHSAEISTNLYESIKAWCGYTTDAYTLIIESGFNGGINIPNKITVMPNSTAENKMFIGFFDNVLSKAQEFISKEDVTTLINTMKTEVLAEVATKYQLKS